ncbi:alkaline phosphatase family protein [Caulobacter segnis]
MFDENDGFFDHVPPPSPPSHDAAGKALGGSTVDVAGMHHTVRNPTRGQRRARRDPDAARLYGLGPASRSTRSRRGAEAASSDSEVFDHTSVIRFLGDALRRPGAETSRLWRRACAAT